MSLLPPLPTKPLSAQALQERYGLGKTKFWQIIDEQKVPHTRWSSKLIRFPISSVALLDRLCLERTVAGPEDLARVADGRRRFNKQSVGGTLR